MNVNANTTKLILRLIDEVADPDAYPGLHSKVQALSVENVFDVVLPLIANETKRSAAVEVLMMADPQKAFESTKHLLQSASDNVRYWMTVLVSEYPTTSAVKSLSHILTTDVDPSTRAAAAIALGNIGDKTALPVLEMSLKSDMDLDFIGESVSASAKEAIHRILDSSTR